MRGAVVRGERSAPRSMLAGVTTTLGMTRQGADVTEQIVKVRVVPNGTICEVRGMAPEKVAVADSWPDTAVTGWPLR